MKTILPSLILTGQIVLENALSKEDFLAGTRIYMLRSNLRLNIGKAVGYNNKILISNTDMKTGSNKDINNDVVYHQKSSGTPPEYGRTESAAHAEPKMY